MNTQRNTPIFTRVFQILSILAILAMVFGTVGSAFAQSNTPTVSVYGELPERGQLVIPFGSQFVVPQEWDGLVVTIWRGMGDSTVQPIIDFGNSIASDRADRYGGEADDYQTVVWDKSVHPLPGFSTRQSCDDTFGHDTATLVAGTSIGDAGCFEVIEYDQSSFPIKREAPAVAPTLVPTATAKPPVPAEEPESPEAEVLGPPYYGYEPCPADRDGRGLTNERYADGERRCDYEEVATPADEPAEVGMTIEKAIDECVGIGVVAHPDVEDLYLCAETDEEPAKPGGLPIWAWILIAVGSVIVIAVIVIAVRRNSSVNVRQPQYADEDVVEGEVE